MPEQKRVVVTGATGLIGTALTRQLLERGYSVTVFSRDPAAARKKLPGAQEHVAWQPGEAGAWPTTLDGAYAVINLAGASISKRWSERSKREMRDSRIVGTRGLVEAIARLANKPEVLVNASAVGYYGYRDDTPLDEGAAPGDDFLARLCQDWEAEALKAEQHGLRVALVRTGIVLDKDEGALSQLLLPFRLFAGGPMGSGRQYWPWVHLDDVVGIFLLALEDERVRGPINATAPQPLSNKEFAKALGRALHRPAIMPTPGFALKLLLGEMAEALVLNGQRAIPKKAQELGYQFRYSELEPALRDTLKH